MKIHQEILMTIWVDDDVDTGEVLCEMDIDIKDNTGKVDGIDWEYGYTEVER